MNKTFRKYASVFIGGIMSMGSIIPTYAETQKISLSADALINNDTGEEGVKVKKGEAFSMQFNMSTKEFFDRFDANYELHDNAEMLKFNNNQLSPRLTIDIPLSSDLFDTSEAEVKINGKTANVAFSKDGLKIDEKPDIMLEDGINNQYESTLNTLKEAIGDTITLEISGLKLTETGESKKSINVSVAGMLQMNANAHIEYYTYPKTREAMDAEIEETNAENEDIKFIDYIYADGASRNDALNEAPKHKNFNFQQLYNADGDETGIRLWYSDKENTEIAGNLFGSDPENRVTYVIRTEFLIAGNAMQERDGKPTDKIPSIEIIPEEGETEDIVTVTFNFFDMNTSTLLEDKSVSIDVDRNEVKRTGKPVSVKDLLNEAINKLKEEGYQLVEGETYPASVNGETESYTIDVEHRIDEETTKEKQTFSRKINYVDEEGNRLGGGSQEVTSDVATTTKTDAVTGEVIDSDIIDTDLVFDEISNFDMVFIPGYKAKDDQVVPEVKVSLRDLIDAGKTEIDPVNIVFEKENEHPDGEYAIRIVSIKYVDTDNDSQDLSKYNETIFVDGFMRDGKFVPNESKPTKCQATVEELKEKGFIMENPAPSSVNGDTEEYTINLKHKTVAASSKSDGTIDRKITLAFSDTDKKETVIQKLNTSVVERTINDEVTGKVVSSSKEYFVSGDMFKAPERKGYTPVVAALPPLSIRGTTDEVLKPEQYAMTLGYMKNDPVTELNVKIEFKDTSSDPQDLSSKTITFTEKDGLSKDAMKKAVNEDLEKLVKEGYGISDKSGLDTLKYEGKESAVVSLVHNQEKSEKTINVKKEDKNSKYARKIILHFDDKDSVTIEQYGDAEIKKETIKDLVTGKTSEKETIMHLSFDELKVSDLPEAKGYKTDAVIARTDYNGPIESMDNVSSVTAELKKDDTPAKPDDKKDNSQKDDEKKSDDKKDSDKKSDNSKNNDKKSQNVSPKEGATSGAKTGVGSPVVAIAVGAAALIGLGAILFFKRRTKPEDGKTSEDAENKTE